MTCEDVISTLKLTPKVCHRWLKKFGLIEGKEYKTGAKVSLLLVEWLLAHGFTEDDVWTVVNTFQDKIKKVEEYLDSADKMKMTVCRLTVLDGQWWLWGGQSESLFFSHTDETWVAQLQRPPISYLTCDVSAMFSRCQDSLGQRNNDSNL